MRILYPVKEERGEKQSKEREDRADSVLSCETNNRKQKNGIFCSDWELGRAKVRKPTNCVL